MPSLVSPQASNIERGGFAVLGVVAKAIDDAGNAAGVSGPDWQNSMGLKLPATTETPRVPLDLLLLDRLLELSARKYLQYLRKDAAYFQ